MRPLLVMLALALGACGVTEPDPRLATPADTIETLLRATHLWRVEARPLGGLRRERLRRPPSDIESMAACFWDFDRDDPASRAMGDFVAGMLAAGQRDLVYHEARDSAVVQTVHRPVYFRRTAPGWVIVLRDTIPNDIREALRRQGRRPLPTPPDEVL